MSTATLTIDLDALVANWRALDARGPARTGAVVKADAYGLGAARAARALARAGARDFFVAVAEEGALLREALWRAARLYVLSGHMAGDTDMIGDLDLVPMINSLDQMIRHVESLPTHPFGLQLDTGMHRLGMEPAEWSAIREIAIAQKPALIMSQLACADAPGHPLNARQLRRFHEMTDGIDCARSLANTGGILLGEEYHFDLTRPGIGLYGGLPFAEARPVVALDAPVIQCRSVASGESVGYGAEFTTARPSRIATISAGYGDGLMRALSPGMRVMAGDVPCPVAGRISMDLIGVDVTDLGHDPKTIRILGAEQGIDALAAQAGTIGYEILTALGKRYARRYSGG